MSALSPNYCNKVERWLLGGVPLERMAMRPEQRFRAALVTDVYRHWIENPSTGSPRKMLQAFARREYAHILRRATQGDPDDSLTQEARELVEVMHIREGVDRSSNEISNDVALLNWLTGKLSTAKKHIHKAMFESNIEWMQNFGRETGTWQAVKQANQDLAKINNDFKDEDDPQEQMPQTQINITGDVSIVKSDRVSLTEDERKKLASKYGLTQKELAQEMEEINGVYQAINDDDEDERDIFVENEQPVPPAKPRRRDPMDMTDEEYAEYIKNR